MCLCIVLGGYLRILDAPSFNPIVPYRYLLPNMYLSVAEIANPDFLGCCCQTWSSLDIARFYEEQCQPSSGSAWPACQKTGNSSTIAGTGGVDTICTADCHTAVTAPTRVGCVVWSQVIIVIAYYSSNI